MDAADIKKLLEKERLEKDVLNRIAWDDRLDGGDFEVAYLDRIKKGLVKVSYASISLQGDFFMSGESPIPVHRIREVSFRGAVVWAKRRAVS